MTPQRAAGDREGRAQEVFDPDNSARYGLTTGDRVRLADTDLLARIERDESSYGDEVLRGWAKTLRTGIMTSAELPAQSELDLFVANVSIPQDGPPSR
jgi:urease alpha subunit